MSGKNFYLRVPQSGTSMRNPLQAAERRSCGYNCMREQCSAKRDLYILMTANGISSPSVESCLVSLTTNSYAAPRFAVGLTSGEG